MKSVLLFFHYIHSLLFVAPHIILANIPEALKLRYKKTARRHVSTASHKKIPLSIFYGFKAKRICQTLTHGTSQHGFQPLEELQTEKTLSRSPHTVNHFPSASRSLLMNFYFSSQQVTSG